MMKRVVKQQAKGRSAPYFNFQKFEKALDKLQQQGVDVISVDYQVKHLKKFSPFKHFFENFSEQQIKAQLTFYAKQFEEPVE